MIQTYSNHLSKLFKNIQTIKNYQELLYFSPLQKWQRHRCEQANTASHAELCRTFHLHNHTLKLKSLHFAKHFDQTLLQIWYFQVSVEGLLLLTLLGPQTSQEDFPAICAGRSHLRCPTTKLGWPIVSATAHCHAIMCMCNPILPWWSKGDCQVLVVPEFVWKAQSYSSLAPKCSLVEQNVVQ